MNKTILISIALVFSAFAQNAVSQEHEVAQKNKAFSKKQLQIKVGDVVSFPNQDPFFHNVFSLSETKTFDLGSYKKGETKKITFNEPGTVEVECAIHPKMTMVIEVK